MSPAARDSALTLALVIAFATLVTAHVAILFGLVRRHRALEALGALALPPLAPYWAITRGMRARAVVWLASAVLYAAALVTSTSSHPSANAAQDLTGSASAAGSAGR